MKSEQAVLPNPCLEEEEEEEGGGGGGGGGGGSPKGNLVQI
jgi:hypothetical protein